MVSATLVLPVHHSLIWSVSCLAPPCLTALWLVIVHTCSTPSLYNQVRSSSNSDSFTTSWQINYPVFTFGLTSWYLNLPLLVSSVPWVFPTWPVLSSVLSLLTVPDRTGPCSGSSLPSSLFYVLDICVFDQGSVRTSVCTLRIQLFRTAFLCMTSDLYLDRFSGPLDYWIIWHCVWLLTCVCTIHQESIFHSQSFTSLLPVSTCTFHRHLSLPDHHLTSRCWSTVPVEQLPIAFPTHSTATHLFLSIPWFTLFKSRLNSVPSSRPSSPDHISAQLLNSIAQLY